MHISHYVYMPRKKSDEDLTKVVSSVISEEDFGTLEKYAKIYYSANLLKLPTISHMVRYILTKWTKNMRKAEQVNRSRDMNPPARNNLFTNM